MSEKPPGCCGHRRNRRWRKKSQWNPSAIPSSRAPADFAKHGGAGQAAESAEACE